MLLTELHKSNQAVIADQVLRDCFDIAMPVERLSEDTTSKLLKKVQVRIQEYKNGDSYYCSENKASYLAFLATAQLLEGLLKEAASKKKTKKAKLTAQQEFKEQLNAMKDEPENQRWVNLQQMQNYFEQARAGKLDTTSPQNPEVKKFWAQLKALQQSKGEEETFAQLGLSIQAEISQLEKPKAKDVNGNPNPAHTIYKHLIKQINKQLQPEVPVEEDTKPEVAKEAPVAKLPVEKNTPAPNTIKIQRRDEVPTFAKHYFGHSAFVTALPQLEQFCLELFDKGHSVPPQPQTVENIQTELVKKFPTLVSNNDTAIAAQLYNSIYRR